MADRCICLDTRQDRIQRWLGDSLMSGTVFQSSVQAKSGDTRNLNRNVRGCKFFEQEMHRRVMVKMTKIFVIFSGTGASVSHTQSLEVRSIHSKKSQNRISSYGASHNEEF